jgi:hypothetical protein
MDFDPKGQNTSAQHIDHSEGIERNFEAHLLQTSRDTTRTAFGRLLSRGSRTRDLTGRPDAGSHSWRSQFHQNHLQFKWDQTLDMKAITLRVSYICQIYRLFPFVDNIRSLASDLSEIEVTFDTKSGDNVGDSDVHLWVGLFGGVVLTIIVTILFTKTYFLFHITANGLIDAILSIHFNDSLMV